MLRRSTLIFIAKRLLQLIPVVLVIGTFNFALLHLAPGDAAEILAGQGGHATPEFVAGLRGRIRPRSAAGRALPNLHGEGADL